MKAIVSFIWGTVKGLGETSLIPSLIRTVKKIDRKGAIEFLDVNGDGKFTMADVKALQWEQVGKLAAVAAILGTLSYFSISFL